MLGIDGSVLSRPPKKQILTVMLQNCENSSVKYSIEKSVTLFHGFVYSISSKLAVLDAVSSFCSWFLKFFHKIEGCRLY